MKMRILSLLHRLALRMKWRGVEIVVRHRIWAEVAR
jgi:hypothetical protein